MYVNRHFDAYVLIGTGDAYTFREQQTPSIFSSFFASNKHQQKQIQEYIH